MKKILSLILAALMLMAALAACDRAPDTDGETDTQGEDTAYNTPAETELQLVKDGKALYKIYCVDVDTYYDAAEYIRNDLGRKAGVKFEFAYGEDLGGNTSIIYVGADCEEAGAHISYNGYGAVFKDGDIYICAVKPENVALAASKLCSTISAKQYVTKDENGLVQMSIPTSLAFIYEPDYELKGAKLLSSEVEKYRIVISEGATLATKMIAERLATDIANLTGFMPKIVSDKAASQECEIVIGSTNRRTDSPTLSAHGYSAVGDGSRLYISYGSAAACEKIYERIRELFSVDTVNLSGEIDDRLTVEKPEDDIRIMTSNVLFTGDGDIPYRQRAALLSQLYLDYMPDFIGLQEAKDGIGEEIYKGVSEYYGRISQLTGHTPILYRKDVWIPCTDGSGADIQKASRREHCWGYEWVMFERIDDPSVKIIVGNLHFPPNGQEYAHKRPAAMDEFNAEVQRLEEIYSDIPMVFTGDYNTKVTTERKEELDDGWAEDIVVDTSLVCGSQLTDDNDDINGSSIDHVCVNTEHIEVIRHRRVSYSLMTKSSDHVPIFVDIRLK